MELLESLKNKFFHRDNAIQDLKTNSSNPTPDKVDGDLTENPPTGFFDDGVNTHLSNGLFDFKLDKILTIQKNWITNYRRISQIPEVRLAIDEILDEALFHTENGKVFNLTFKENISSAIEKKIQDEFNNILNTFNIDKHLYRLFEKFYIDGQLILHCSYINDNIKNGIKYIRILNPGDLFYNNVENIWKYKEPTNITSFQDEIYSFNGEMVKFTNIFQPEEIIRIDSGIYDNKIILSDLHSAVKVANNLQTLEEMLVPMRFSRSVSRRVFNIDVANMNSKKAEEYLLNIQNKFKYKKFYDLENGTISNQQHISSLTEDYWFPNRGGAKGTTVDTIDETGNLGETGDLDYMKKKLFFALKVPVSRLGIDDRAEFDFSATNVSRDELKFFNFISRKRKQFSEILFQLLKRQLISKNIIQEKEFNELRYSMKIEWISENKFYEKMNDDKLTQAVSTFREYEELATKGWISKEFLYKRVLKLTDDDIKELQTQIEKEKTDKLYKNIKVGDGVENDNDGLGDSFGDNGVDNNSNDSTRNNEVDDLDDE